LIISTVETVTHSTTTRARATDTVLGDVVKQVYLYPRSIASCHCHSHHRIGKHPSMLVYSARGNDIVLCWYTRTFWWYGFVCFLSGFMQRYRWVCKRNNGAWKKIEVYK